MRDWRRRLAAGFLVSMVPVLSFAQARPLVIVGGSPPTVQLQRLDGSLRGIARASAAGAALTAESLRILNPAAHLRVAAPSLTPEVLVDVVAASDPAALEQSLQSLGMRQTARASNLIGGWLPVTALAQVA